VQRVAPSGGAPICGEVLTNAGGRHHVAVAIGASRLIVANGSVAFVDGVVAGTQSCMCW
jgi:hypothetical protein